jgi:hypothetical protein
MSLRTLFGFGRSRSPCRSRGANCRPRAKAYRPRVEALEDRRCPAVTVTQLENTLYLVGDAADDWVAVRDEGGQAVEVQTARGAETFAKVSRVVGDLGGANDTFEFHQATGQPSALLDVLLDLADGDDRLVYPDPAAEALPMESVLPATYSFDLRGGLGNDVMTLRPLVVPGLNLSFRADLGDGNDQLSAQMTNPSNDMPVGSAGSIIPCISLAAEAGAGDDAVNVQLGGPDTLDPLQLAEVSVFIGGGDGGDSVGIVIEGSRIDSLSEAMSLGGGDDVGYVINWRNVAVTGVLSQSVDAGAGGDTVGVIISSGRIGSLSEAVSLGDGDDVGYVIIGNNVAVPGPVTVRMDGGDGIDDLAAQVGFNPQPDPPGGPLFGSAVLLSLTGGPGADSAAVLVEDAEGFTAFAGSLTVRVALGGDDDLANVVIQDANDVASPLTVAVDGEGGDDGIAAAIGFAPRTGSAPVSVLAEFRGGDGQDTIDGFSWGEWSGFIWFNLRGDAGDDAIGFHGVIGEGSTGALAVGEDGGDGGDVLTADLLIPTDSFVPISLQMLGGNDDDLLWLDLPGGSDTTPGLILLDGGLGLDLAHAPPGAVVRNCEGRI